MISFSKIGTNYHVTYQSRDFESGITPVTMAVFDQDNAALTGSPYTMVEFPYMGIYQGIFLPVDIGIHTVIISEAGTKKSSATIQVVEHDLDTIGNTVDGIGTSPGFSSGGYVL